MERLIGNAVVGQSGGPTAAINATLSGVIRGAFAAKEEGIIPTLYGMRNGIEGFLKEDLVDLFAIFDTEDKLSTLQTTPAAALGSCRRKLKNYEDDADTYARLLSIFKKYDIRYFFYIGGNDSMDTVLKLSRYAAAHDYEIRVVGVPKTIDNDLVATDHTPGFGSAAKYIATTMKEILRDISVYSMKAVTIVEIMGRDAGWLTAAAALPSLDEENGTDLIYLPEVAFDMDKFIDDVKRVQEDHPAVHVAVSEGIKLANGEYVGADSRFVATDVFGHVHLSGAAKVLENVVKEKLGCKVRSIELNLPQRCASHLSSLADINESVSIGSAAVKAAVDGKTAVMMTFIREEKDEYSVKIGCEDIASIANEIKGVPAEYINSAENGITKEGLNYLAPLIEGEISCTYKYGMPVHFVIK